MSKKTNELENIQGAGLGRRLGAYLLDMLIVYCFYLVVALIIIFTTGYEEMMIATAHPEYGKVYLPYKLMLVSLPIIWFIYSVILECGAKEATWGKRAAKLQVVHVSGQKARGLDVLVRNVVKVLPMLINYLFVGEVVAGIAAIFNFIYFIVPLCNRNHRTIHDFVAGSVVAKREHVDAKRKVFVMPELNVNLPSAEELKAARAGEEADYGKTMAPVSKAKKILCVSGLYRGSELPLDGPIIMGRDSAACNLIFENDTKGVSKVHCCVEMTDGCVTIVDLGSTYGTIVNSKTINAGEREKLNLGDRFKIGKFEEFVVQ